MTMEVFDKFIFNYDTHRVLFGSKFLLINVCAFFAMKSINPH